MDTKPTAAFDTIHQIRAGGDRGGVESHRFNLMMPSGIAGYGAFWHVLALLPAWAARRSSSSSSSAATIEQKPCRTLIKKLATLTAAATLALMSGAALAQNTGAPANA